MALSLDSAAQSLIPGNEVSTKYFGPNALPIPDIHKGEITGELEFYLYGDYTLGFKGDKTITPSSKFVIPLFSERVSLSCWWSIYEFYNLTTEKAVEMPMWQPEQLRGCGIGDVTLTTDIQILKQSFRRYSPDIVLRVGLKIASGAEYPQARFYDSPAYFFDASIAKSIYFKGSFLKELRFGVTGGFLCWQIDNATQNDAYMYGALTSLDTKFFDVSFAWGGYTGWVKNGDAPQSIKVTVSGHIKRFSPFFRYEYGLRDYPYNLFRIGISYRLPIKSLAKHENVNYQN